MNFGYIISTKENKVIGINNIIYLKNKIKIWQILN